MEIPVIHEVSGTKVNSSVGKPCYKLANSSSSSSSGQSSISSSSLSSSSSSTNRLLQLARASPLNQQKPGQHTVNARKDLKGATLPTHQVHKETSSFDRSGNGLEVKTGHQHRVISHTRLPSTDSGIQADGGYDSLSRYKGKSFLSCSSSATSDSLSSESSGSGVGSSICSSNGSGKSSCWPSPVGSTLANHTDKGGDSVGRVLNVEGPSGGKQPVQQLSSSRVAPFGSPTSFASSKQVLAKTSQPTAPEASMSRSFTSTSAMQPKTSPSPLYPPTSATNSSTSNTSLSQASTGVKGQIQSRIKAFPANRSNIPAKPLAVPAWRKNLELCPNSSSSFSSANPTLTTASANQVSTAHNSSRPGAVFKTSTAGIGSALTNHTISNSQTSRRQVPGSAHDPPTSNSSPKVTVFSSEGGVKLTFTSNKNKNSETVGQSVSSGTNTATPSVAANPSSAAIVIEPTNNSKPNISAKPNNPTNVSSKTVVANTAQSAPVRYHAATNQPLEDQGHQVALQGQGCIALTKPLRIGTPAKISVRAVQPTVLSSQPAHLIPTSASVSSQTKQPLQQQQSTLQHQESQPKISTTKVKPKIAPRPSVTPRTYVPQQANITSNSNVTSTTNTVTSITTTLSSGNNRPSTSSTSTTTSTISISNSNPSSLRSHDIKAPIAVPASISDNSPSSRALPSAEAPRFVTEIPVHHRGTSSTPSSSPGRTEIPVSHAPIKTSTLYRPPSSLVSNTGTPSFSNSAGSARFHTYKSGSVERQQSRPVSIIFDNMGGAFNIRDGFSFDDDRTKMRHAELALKHSDELISDALKMLNAAQSPTSPTSSPLDSVNSSKFTSSLGQRSFPEEERIVEGADSSESVISEKEHTVPIYDVKTGKLYVGGDRGSVAVGSSKNTICLSGPDLHQTESEVPHVSWKERKERIDSALSWLKQELAGLRDMDNTLISQFQRCQDTIETLKTQRDVWEGLCEEGEEGEYWDDYEINEFNRRYLDSPGGSSCSQFSPVSRDPSLQDMTLAAAGTDEPASAFAFPLPVPQLELPQMKDDVGAGPRRGSVTQDVEATL